MKPFLYLFIFLLPASLISQTGPAQEIQSEEGPPNPRPGRCYVKLINSDKTIRWKAILCEWKEWGSLSVLRDELEPAVTNYDEHYINKRLRPLIQRRLPIELKSYYASKASDTTDVCLAMARAREVGEYLIQEGLDRNQLKITIEPITTEKDTMWMQYRVINAVPKKWYLQ